MSNEITPGIVSCQELLSWLQSILVTSNHCLIKPIEISSRDQLASIKVNPRYIITAHSKVTYISIYDCEKIIININDNT
jgi:hypothetical protein